MLQTRRTSISLPLTLERSVQGVLTSGIRLGEANISEARRLPMVGCNWREGRAMQTRRRRRGERRRWMRRRREGGGG